MGPHPDRFNAGRTWGRREGLGHLLSSGRGNQAWEVFATGTDSLTAELRLLPLPGRGMWVSLSFLCFTYNIHSHACSCRAYQVGSRKFSIRMLVAQEGGWLAPSQSTMPASAFSKAGGKTQAAKESQEEPQGRGFSHSHWRLSKAVRGGG